MTTLRRPDGTTEPVRREWQIPPIGSLATLLAGEGVSRVLSFVAIALLTRRLGPVVWAPVAVALSVLQFGTLFVECGMRLLGAREVAGNPDRAHRLVRPIVSTQLVIALAFVVLAFVAAGSGFIGRDLGRLLPGFAVSLVAFPFFAPWVFQGLGAMEWVAIPQVTRYAAFLVLAAMVVLSPEHAPLIPWLEAAAMAVGASVAAWGLIRYRVRATVGLRSAFEWRLMREAIPIAASQLIWVARMYLPIVALWFLSTREAVGQFDVAHRILMVLQAGITVYLTNLYTPLSRAAHGPRRAFTALLRGSAAVALAGAVVITLLLVVRPGALLGVLFGEAFNAPAAATSLTFLALVVPVITLRGHCHYALVALGRQRRELFCSVIGAAVLLYLLPTWIPADGVRGAALAMLSSEFLGLGMTAIALADALKRDLNGGMRDAERGMRDAGRDTSPR